MSDIHHRLDEIADLQGRSRIDGRQIAGFGSNDPPPPSLPPGFGGTGTLRLDEDPDAEGFPELDEPEDEQPDFQNATTSNEVLRSPTPAHDNIARFGPISSKLPEPMTQFEVTVLAVQGGGCVGSVDSREVVLTDESRAAVRRIVLRELQREIDGKLAAVTPRRKRAGKVRGAEALVGSVAAGEIPAPAPRRRVRRKSALRP